MSAHAHYDVEHVFHGETFLAQDLRFQDAVDLGAQCLKEGSWPVTIRPTKRVDTEAPIH